MHADEHINRAVALAQWQQICDIYTEQLGWQVELIDPIEHLPDMVFATDCCLIRGDKILLSRFRHPERQGETEHYRAWFARHGYTNLRQTTNFFEGGGDNLFCGDKILAGHGFRSAPEAAGEISDYFGLEVVPLRIVDPAFYHLDTSVAVLSSDTVAFYPPALDAASQQRLRGAVPHVIEATLEEARGFGLNAVSDDHTIITSNESPSLLQKYHDAGFTVIGTPILEFRKSGGGVKCLTLTVTR